jgi:hypothetical protein
MARPVEKLAEEESRLRGVEDEHVAGPDGTEMPSTIPSCSSISIVRPHRFA